jgi:hypothetical protein
MVMAKSKPVKKTAVTSPLPSANPEAVEVFLELLARLIARQHLSCEEPVRNQTPESCKKPLQKRQ